MPAHYAIAEYQSLEDARVGLEVLEKSKYTADEVSLITKKSDDVPAELTSERDELRARSVVVPSAGLGMFIGGSVAAPLAIGTMIGPFIVAGCLAGLAIGAGVGVMLSELSSASRKDTRADYEARLQSGSTLIVVNVDNEIRLKDVVSLLKTSGPKSLESFESS